MLALILSLVFLGLLLLLLLRKRRSIARFIYSMSTGEDNRYPQSYEESVKTPGYLPVISALRQTHLEDERMRKDKASTNWITRQQLHTSPTRRAVIVPTNSSPVP